MRTVFDNQKTRCLGCMREYDTGIRRCPYCGYIHGADDNDQCFLPPGTVLKGRFMVGRSLGSGGFGVTYVAWDHLLEKKVAIKEYLPSELACRTMGERRVTVHDPESAEKFEAGKNSFMSESRRLAQFINDPGVVSIYECFFENDTAYIVMECLEGQTLQQMINEHKKLPYAEVAPIFVDVLDTLERVHSTGMLHRDIAPDNIFICEDGTVKLIDFGAARYMTTTHSRSLSMMLKMGFAPIEQYSRHGEQGPWTDVYAVAASMYNALTGIVPPDSYDRVEEDRLRRPSSYARGIPAEAEKAILNALNLVPANRTQSAGQFADELCGDIGVQRQKERLRHEDTGRIAGWMKLAAACGAFLVVALGVVLALTGSGLFRSGAYVLPTDMARVPSVVDDSIYSAGSRLSGDNLNIVVGGRITDAYYENNYVLLQNPRSGNVAHRGSVVSVTASMKPNEYHIPNLVNFTREAAVKILEDAGFVVRLDEGESTLAAPGAVVSQTPAGNTIVYQGVDVTLCINISSTGSDRGETVVLPDYTGEQFSDAQAAAAADGLYMAICEGVYSDEVPLGEIIGQTIPQGGTLRKGETVLVTMSLGKRTIIVPNLVYMPGDEALAEIENRLLTGKIEYVRDASVREGLVVSQSPDAGTSIYEEGEVTITVCLGYDVEVPDTVGKPQSEAMELLTQVKLGGAVVFANSDTVPEGSVIAQSVDAGESVAQGTIITLTISAGKRIINVTGVSLSTAAVTLDYGEVFTLISTVAPSDATTTVVTWATGDAAVATVSDSGVVTATGIGATVISVTTMDGGFTAECVVTVKDNITLSNNGTITLTEGDVYNITATYKGSKNTVAGRWTSAAPAVASVKGSGGSASITAASPGTTVVTITDEYGSSASVTVSVYGKWSSYTEVSSFDYNAYEYREKKQYSSRDTVVYNQSGDPSVPADYEFISRTDNGYTDWSGWTWTDSLGANSDTYEGQTYTTYRYYQFVCGCGTVFPHWGKTHHYYLSGSSCYNTVGEGSWRERWEATPPSGYPSNTPSWTYTWSANKYPVYINGEIWYYERRNQPTGTAMEYRTRGKMYTYRYWGSWGSWTDDAIAATGDRQVRNRSVYSCRRKP